MNRKAQHVIEYLLLIASAMVVFLVIAGPMGFIRRGVDDSINRTMNLIKPEDPARELTEYYWSSANCDCSGSRQCVYPGGDEIFVICRFRCVSKDTGGVVDDWFCLNLLGYKPAQRSSCGNQPCCGNGAFEPSYGEQCDASAGFTETCESRFGSQPHGWSGSVRCTDDCKIADDCGANPPPRPDVCGDNKLTGSEDCDVVNGNAVFRTGLSAGCTDYVSADGQPFEGGVLGCNTSGQTCTIDKGNCYICAPGDEARCGSGLESRPDPQSSEDCFRNGTEFVSRLCTRENGTTFSQAECRSNEQCGTGCAIIEDYATPCPNSTTPASGATRPWRYVDTVQGCDMNNNNPLMSKTCLAWCNGDLESYTYGANRTACRCPKTGFVFDPVDQTCKCPSPPFVLDADGNCLLPGTWLNVDNSSKDCASTCATASMSSGPSPEGMVCASGENRPQTGQGVISYVHGIWGGDRCLHEITEGPIDMTLVHVESKDRYECYRPGQKRDHDATDILVACYCIVAEN